MTERNDKGQFELGHTGLPNAGRPKGSRAKLGEQFLEALQKDFEEHGLSAIVETRETKPDVYVRVIAGLLPSEHKLTITDQFSEMTDVELAERLQRLAATIAPFLNAGDGGIEAGVEGTKRKALPSRVH